MMHAPFPAPTIPPPPGAAAPTLMLRVIIALIAVIAIVAPALLVHFAPKMRAGLHARAIVPHVIPATEIPKIAPPTYQDLAPDDARSINAGIPFTDAPVPPASPLRLIEAPIDQARAIDCLAAAELYEAGDDAEGERAVAQVVLNRLRHPAFPKSVCGVVFQGAERRTGCQFSFTCDGTLDRFNWRADQWARARFIANAALSGAVYAKVGYATHYHTVAVVPYWIGELDKLTSVGTHLFYRWSGWWGTPAAFTRRTETSEPVVAKMAPFSAAHRANVTLIDLMTPDQHAAAIAGAIEKLPKPVAGDNSTFLVTLPANLGAGDLARLAVHSCGERSYCKFLGWTSAAQTPRKLPVDPHSISTMAFSYLRDHDIQFDRMLWNCKVFAGIPRGLCMKTQVFMPSTPIDPPVDDRAPTPDNATAP